MTARSLLLLVAIVFAAALPTAAQSATDSDTTYRAGVRATHDVLTMSLGIRGLGFDERMPIAFHDADAVGAAVETVWLYDSSLPFEGTPIDANALPDTGSVARPFLVIRSAAFARALTAFKPHFMRRVFSPPFDTDVNDSSISYLFGFRTEADRAAFIEAVKGLSGVMWAYEDREIDPSIDDI